MIGIRNIHLGYSDRALGWVCLPDRLKDVGGGAPKFHGLRGDLHVRGLINSGPPLVGL